MVSIFLFTFYCLKIICTENWRYENQFHNENSFEIESEPILKNNPLIINRNDNKKEKSQSEPDLKKDLSCNKHKSSNKLLIEVEFADVENGEESTIDFNLETVENLESNNLNKSKEIDLQPLLDFLNRLKLLLAKEGQNNLENEKIENEKFNETEDKNTDLK